MLHSMLLDVGYGIFLFFMLVLSWAVFGFGLSHYKNLQQPYFYHMSIVMLGLGMVLIFMSAAVTTVQLWMPEPLPVMSTTWRMLLSAAHAWAIVGAVSVCSTLLAQPADHGVHDGAATISVLFIAVASTYLCLTFRGCEQDALVTALTRGCCSKAPASWIAHSKNASTANDRLLRGVQDSGLTLEELRRGPPDENVDERSNYEIFAREVLDDINAWMAE